MTIAKAFKEFFYKLTGVTPNASNIADVVSKGSANVGNLTTLNASAIKYEAGNKSFLLNSSTTDSTKQFRITVDDSGALTAAEVVADAAE